MLIYLWIFVFAVFLGTPLVYFLFMRRFASKPWRLHTNQNYRPSVTVLIPTYNEGKTIKLKLENLLRLKYPRNLLQIVFVDSASGDDTVQEILKFIESHPELNTSIINETARSGKSNALNLALRHSTGEVVVVSDADCFWPSDILEKTLPYLADDNIGAVAGQERLLNPKQSWTTETEALYRDRMFEIQLGESKFYSTVQFEGGFGAYKRKVLSHFDIETGSDDSGTALNLIQGGVRTIVLPEAVFFTFFPHTWSGKIIIKLRRARQFVQIWAKCFKLMIQGKLVLPKRIFLPQAFFLFINPFIFLVFIHKYYASVSISSFVFTYCSSSSSAQNSRLLYRVFPKQPYSTTRHHRDCNWKKQCHLEKG